MIFLTLSTISITIIILTYTLFPSANCLCLSRLMAINKFRSNLALKAFYFIVAISLRWEISNNAILLYSVGALQGSLVFSLWLSVFLVKVCLYWKLNIVAFRLKWNCCVCKKKMKAIFYYFWVKINFEAFCGTLYLNLLLSIYQLLWSDSWGF